MPDIFVNEKITYYPFKIIIHIELITPLFNSKIILVTLLKRLQSDCLMKCKVIVIMTLKGAKKTKFLDT